MWILVISLPTLITWATNIRYSLVLFGDPNMIPATVGVIAVGTLLILDNPQPPRINYRAWYFCIYGSAVVMLLYGTVSVFRVSYVIVFTLTLIASCQVFCKASPPKPTTPNNINQ